MKPWTDHLERCLTFLKTKVQTRCERIFHLPACKTQTFNYKVLTGASLIAQLVKNPPAMQETPFRFVSQEDPLEKG